MKALCIDPGFENIGAAIVEFSGKLGDCTNIRVLSVHLLGVTSTYYPDLYKSSDNFIRTSKIYEQLSDLMRLHKDVSVLCMESMSYSRNASANAKISMALGALSVIASQRNLSVLEAPPQKLKEIIYGKKKLSKKESKELVETNLKIRFGDNLLKLLEGSGIIKSKWNHIYDALSSCYLLEYPDSQKYKLGSAVSYERRSKKK